MDDFGIGYLGKEHALHLLKTLELNYEITTDWEGTKFAGIDLAWDYHASLTVFCRVATHAFFPLI